MPTGAFSFWGNTKQMKRTFTHCLAIFSVLIVLISSSIAFGQAKINMDDMRWVSIGGGLRTAFRSTEVGLTGDYAKDFTLENIRLYVNAQLHKDFQVEFNTEYDGSGDIMVLDAVVKYSPRPYFNIWMGRHLVPSDRANLDGPFFLNAYDYPGLVSRYPGIFAGRDNGVSVNGDIKGGKFKYAFGMYEGTGSVTTSDPFGPGVVPTTAPSRCNRAASARRRPRCTCWSGARPRPARPKPRPPSSPTPPRRRRAWRAAAR